MKIITYDVSDGWGSLDASKVLGDEVRDESLDDWLKRAGFSVLSDDDALESEIGYGRGIRIHDAAHGDASIFEITDGSTIELVFVTNVQSRLKFRMELLPLNALALYRRLDRMVDLMMKAFCVYHGHEADDACDECAPTEMYLWRRRKEAAKKKEAEKR